ncbi:unnamed protein product [Penicillium olsonii]|uniref:YAG7-like dimerisation domain-containing protein n=1 Tax=Penicillium olsonii TaxID=99116 RepID=A0A9W4HVZ1_PENOL|nr:unnamed protein product [Penicillium olsonii]CAG8142509.1 unnamed protein product [Penicillium olsonii]
MPAATQKLKVETGLSRASSVSKTESHTDGENNYLKELQKSLRNTTKKLNASAKVDAILAENPDKSLDQLVEEKKINSDQRAQHLRKSALQAAAAQTEEQIGHYKHFAAQYEERLVAQKSELAKDHEEELEAVRANAIADATEASRKALRTQLHTMTKFLCGAAMLRRDGVVNTETQAFEGVLFQVYGGSHDSVNNMLKVINGADEKITAVEGDVLDFTYADLKQACERFAPAEEGSEASTETVPASDPTIANAGFTELQDSSLTNAAPAAQANQLAPPEQTVVTEAANEIAEKSAGVSSDDSERVEVPRNPAETETGLQATPASADAGLTNGSVGVDAANAGGQETSAKKPRDRRRHHHNRSTRDGQQGPRDGQPQREGQKPQREGQGKREGSKAQRETQQCDQPPRDGQQGSREGRGRGGRSRGGEGRGRGGRGRGRGGAGSGNVAGDAPAPAKSTE